MKTQTTRDSKTSQPTHPAEAAFQAFLRSLGLTRQIMEPYFARFGISGPQWGVLRVLHRAELNQEGALRLKDIGERLFIQPPSVTGVIDRMERGGLLKRTDSKADLRVRRVALTPAGRRLLESVLQEHPKRIQSLFGGFSPDDLNSFLELLRKWEAHLSKLTQGQPALAPNRRM